MRVKNAKNANFSKLGFLYIFNIPEQILNSKLLKHNGESTVSERFAIRSHL